MTKAKNEVFISLLGGYIMKNIFFFRGGGGTFGRLSLRR